jgi:hypothetical protein
MRKVFVFMAVLSLAACKKEKEKDLSDLFTDTVWSGEFQRLYSQVAEPFSIKFNANNNFKWYEARSQFTGTYTIDEADKEITLDFSGGWSFTAEIEDEQIRDVIYVPGTGWTIHNGKFINQPDQSLDNTAWVGTYLDGTTATAYELNFYPSSQMTYAWGGNPHTGQFAYLREEGVIYFDYAGAGFGVLLGDTIKGVLYSGSTDRPWSLARKK